MINGVGLQRSGYSQEDIGALKAAFMRLFSRRARMNGVPIRDRVQGLLSTEPLNEHVEYLCRFLLRSFAHGRHGRYLESLRKDPVYRPSWRLTNGYTLTVHVVGGGAVRKMRDSSPVASAEVFELTALADPGWTFAGWNGDLSGTENPVQIIVDGDKTLTATFKGTS